MKNAEESKRVSDNIVNHGINCGDGGEQGYYKYLDEGGEGLQALANTI
ncbi:MAG: hypothetical protein ABSA46_18180 [Thermodesulfovibrionales bacterium]|jgi:hypothetical protein